MICPFCKNELKIYDGIKYNYQLPHLAVKDKELSYRSCANIKCMDRDMARYVIVYSNNIPTYEEYMLENLYIKVYIDEGHTSIFERSGSHLELIVKVNRAIIADLTNMEVALNKFKTIILLS